MDPFTQGALGSALPQATRLDRAHVRISGVLGFLAGMAADLDVLIRSPSDPLSYLVYHRQFTHSLVFIPLGGLVTALVLHWIFRHRWQLSLRHTILFCTLGYATHALLDMATSYGTVLFWPFSDERFAWKIVSVVDPLFTLPLAALVVVSALRRKPLLARIALLWALLYLTVGTVQHHDALRMGRELAASRGHVPVRLQVQPSFGNILVWKTLYEVDGRYHVDAVRAGVRPKVYPGDTIPKLDIARDLPWLKPDSQQARDIERFRWFSDGYLALDRNHPNRVIDVRYSVLPNEIDALWSIELSGTAEDDDHARYLTHRRDARRRIGELWELIVGGA